MTSFPERDAQQDQLLTPHNSMLIIIDYQPTQINSINSMSRAKLVRNIVLVAKLAKIYKLPIILSTVNVATGKNHDTVPILKKELDGVHSYDRTTINAWEDREFYEAVKTTQRKKIIMTALWTEACLTFPTLDAIKEGFEVYPVVDAIGGTSKLAHKVGLKRIQQAGAHLTSIAQLSCELQRDWDRKNTVPDFVKILEEAGIFLKLS